MCQYKRYLCPVILKCIRNVITQIIKAYCDNPWGYEGSDIV